MNFQQSTLQGKTSVVALLGSNRLQDIPSWVWMLHHCWEETQPAEPMLVIAVIKQECCKAAMDTAGLSELNLSAVPLDIRIR